MRTGQPSRTAAHNALFRAIEAHQPPGERVVDDDLAKRFLGPAFRAVAAACRVGAVRSVVCRLIDRRWPGPRTAVIARTRLIDERIGESADHVDQVVVLGAGFDTRAWRLPALAALPVYEVDHPDTQARKRAALGDLAERPAVHFVATDFNLATLSGAMTDAGFDAAVPALYLWEGTTNYLDAAAVDATLRWCGRGAAGSHLVFTYIDDEVLDHPERYVGAARMLDTVRKAGEAMTFGLDPAAMPAYLAERGLALVSDVGAAEFRAACFGEAAARMRAHEFYRVAVARVDAPRTKRMLTG